MQSERVNKNDPSLRTALLEAYNHKCIYTGDLVSYGELQVDHIIPEKLESNPVEFKQRLKELDLPENFELNSLWNLVPTTRRPNSLKSDKPFSLKGTRYFLEIAQDKAHKVKEVLKKIEEKAKQEKFIQNFDIISKETSYYDERYYIGTEDCAFSRKHVCLSAFFPKYPMLQGSCLITFKALRLRDCQITFSHEEIISNLFEGLYSELNFRHRGFFVGQQLENEYIVQLGNNRFALSLEELEELSWTIDELSKPYIERLESIEKVMEIQLFEKSTRIYKGFRLLQIRSGLWNQLLDFAAEFHCSKGITKWHVFDDSFDMLKVYGGSGNPYISQGYHAILYPEQVDDISFGSFRGIDAYLWITLVPVSAVWEDKLDNYNVEKIWSAKRTYDWLVYELIPYSFFFFEKEKSFLRSFRKRSYQNFLDTFNIEYYAYLNHKLAKPDIKHISDINECLKVVNNLQIHFTMVRQVYLRAHEVRPLYELILNYLKQDPLQHYGYVISKISNENSKDLNQLISELERYLDLVPDGEQNPMILDHTLRGLGEIIQHGSIEFDERRIQEFVDSISSLWENKEFCDKLKRMQAY